MTATPRDAVADAPTQSRTRTTRAAHAGKAAVRAWQLSGPILPIPMARFGRCNLQRATTRRRSRDSRTPSCHPVARHLGRTSQAINTPDARAGSRHSVSFTIAMETGRLTSSRRRTSPTPSTASGQSKGRPALRRHTGRPRTRADGWSGWRQGRQACAEGTDPSFCTLGRCDSRDVGLAVNLQQAPARHALADTAGPPLARRTRHADFRRSVLDWRPREGAAASRGISG